MYRMRVAYESIAFQEIVQVFLVFGDECFQVNVHLTDIYTGMQFVLSCNSCIFISSASNKTVSVSAQLREKLI